MILNPVELKGESYFHVLNRIHLELQPWRYLEIGVAMGSSLALARKGCYAVVVDPEPRISKGFLAWTQLYEMTSEEFFNAYEGDPFDLIFLDGMHQFDTLVQDFCGAERVTHPGTIMVIHDTIPLSAETSQHDYKEGFWTGDVWKLVPTLKEARPDLKVFTIGCPPSGLTVVKNFDKKRGLPQISVDKYAQKDFAWLNREWQKILNMVENRPESWLAEMF